MTALKTLSMRLRSTKAELTEAGEDAEGAAESVSKLRDQVMALTNVDGEGGVDILTPDGSAYKSVFEVYREIAAVWDQIDDLDQSALLELLTGKHMAQAGAALLANWETVEKSLETSQNSAGSAEKENERYVNSIQGQLNILKNDWNEIWTSNINKEFVVFLIQVGQQVLNLVSDFGLLQTAVAGVGIYKFVKDFGRLKEIGNIVKQLGSISNIVSGVDDGGKIAGVAKLLDTLDVSTARYALSQAKLTKETKEAIIQQMANGVAMQGVATATSSVAAAQAGATTATNVFTASLTGLSVTIKSLASQFVAFLATPQGAMLALVAVSAASALAISKHAENVRKEIADASEQSVENINSLKEEMSSIEDIVDRADKSFAELSKGVDLLTGKNISLSDDDYKEFLEISNELAETFPTLPRIYDENGNAIVNLGTDAKSTSGYLRELLETQRDLNNFKIVQELPNIFEEAKVSSKEYGETVEQLREEFSNMEDSFNNFNFDNLSEQIEKFGKIQVSGPTRESAEAQAKMYRDLFDQLGVLYSESTWQVGGDDYVALDILRMSDEDVANIKEKLSAGINDIGKAYSSDLGSLAKSLAEAENSQKESWSNLRSNLFSWLSLEDDYKVMADTAQAAVQSAINNLDFSTLNFESFDELTGYIRKNIIDLINKDSRITAGINITEAFNAGDIDYRTYSSMMEDVMDYLEQALSDADFSAVQNLFSSKLADLTKEAMSYGLTPQAESYILSMMEQYGVNTEQEILALINALQEANGDINAAFKKYAEDNSDLMFEDKTSDIGASLNKYLNTLDALKTAQEELNSTGVLTEDTAKTLTGTFGSLDNILIMTSKGWELNTDAIETYKNGEDDVIQSELRDHLNDLQDQYSQNKSELESLNEEIANAKNTDSDYVTELERKRSALEDTQNSLEGQITTLRDYQAELYNAKSTYNDFINSFSEAKPWDEYDAIVEKLENVKELAEGGEWGDSSLRSFVDLFSNEDLSSAPVEKIMGLYDEARKKADRYFTESSQGSINFIEDLKDLGYAFEDANGNLKFDVGNINEAAKQFDVDVDAMLIAFENLQRYGYEINLGDFVSQIGDVNTLTDAINRLEQEKQNLLSQPTYSEAEVQGIDDMIQKYKEQIAVVSGLRDSIIELNNMSPTDSGYSDLSAKVNQQLDELGMTKDQVMSIQVNADTSKANDAINETASEQRTTPVGLDPKSSLNADILRITMKQRQIPAVLSNESTARLKSQLDAIFNQPRTIRYNVQRTGGLLGFLTGGSSGSGATANWRGTAYNNGRSMTAGYSGRALVGELGPELLVRDGIASLIGRNGAEYTNIRKDDIIFNHKQTEQLQKYGHITSRGKAFASGTVHAYAGGTGGINDVTGGGPASLLTSMKKAAATTSAKEAEKSAKKAEKSASKANNAVSEAAKSSEDIYDYFERMINVLEQSISYIDDALENINGSVAKNFLIDKQIAYTRKEIEGYTQAIQMYTKEAEAALAKLPADIQAKIVDGQVEIARYQSEGDETVTSLIDDYVKWDDKVQDCKQSIEQQTTALREMGKLKFDNIIDDFEQITETYENTNDLIGKQIDLIEEAGGLVGEDLYASQRTNYQRMIDNLTKQRSAAVAAITEGLNDGTIKQGDENWQDMISTINDLDGAILDAKQSVEELNNAIVESRWEVFDLAREQIENINTDLDGMVNLLSDFTDIQVSDGHGTWTDEALTQIGLLAQQYELNKAQAQEYEKAQSELDRMYEDGVYSTTEYLEKLAELKQEQWSSIDAYKAVEDAIMSLNEARVEEECEAIQEEIDAFKELTDAQIEALRATEDLHDYQMSISEKTKNVSDIQRQLAAMQNDNTAATVAKRKQLEEQLKEAQTDLAETERDHSVEQQENALNKQYEEYEKRRQEEMEALRETLNHRQDIIDQSFEEVKNNADIVGNEIEYIANQHGLNISSAITNAWKEGSNAISEYGDYLHTHSSAFMEELDGVESGIYDLKEQADQASLSLGYMFNTSAENLIANINSAKDAIKDLQTSADSMVDVSHGNSNYSPNQNTPIHNTSGSVSAPSHGTSNSSNSSPAYRFRRPEPGIVEAYDANTGELIGRYTLDEAEEMFGDLLKFKKGGRIEKSKNSALNAIARSVGEDTLVAAKDGEAILTRKQSDAIIKLAPIMEQLRSSLRNRTSNKDVPSHAVSNTVSIGSLVTVNGSIDDNNVDKIASISKKQVAATLGKMNRDLKYNGY